VILPLLVHRNLATLLKVIRLWIVVLVSNIAGAHAIAWTLANTSAFKPEVRHAFEQISRESAAVGFGDAVLRGVFAGWLIAFVVWLLAAADSRRLAIIAIPTYIVGLASLTHVIVGSIEVLFLVMVGGIGWGAFWGGYFAPTLLGNVLGGVSLVSVLNHAQVIAGKPGRGNQRWAE
jgi:formate/nitrite transporter FocA (FNT family)